MPERDEGAGAGSVWEACSTKGCCQESRGGAVVRGIGGLAGDMTAQGLLGFPWSFMGGPRLNEIALATVGKWKAGGPGGSREASYGGHLHHPEESRQCLSPHHLFFLSSPVCLPLGIINKKNPPTTGLVARLEAHVFTWPSLTLPLL